MEQSLFVELLAALDVLVLRPVGGGLFEKVGIAPNWAARFLTGPFAADAFDPARLFPFLEDFVADAAHQWMSDRAARIDSGVWTEVDAAGEEQLLEASAMSLGGSPVLVIASAEAQGQIRSIIQKARTMSQSMGRAAEQLTAEKTIAQTTAATKSRFLAHMTHELRTPLNIVIGYAELLMDDAKGQGKSALAGDLEKIRSAARDLLALIGDILDLSKIEAGRVPLRIETFDVAGLVRDVALAVRPLTDRKSNELKIELGDGLGVVQGDAIKVRQCLLNLLSNAAKFTQNGLITLSAARQARDSADRLIFAVADTGIGLTTDQLARVFEPYAQADAATAARFGGTGLGLSITRELCRLMGGEVVAKSQPGKGSIFTIALPANAMI